MSRRWRDRRRHDPAVPVPAERADGGRRYRMSLASSWAAAKVVRRITVTVLTSWRVPPGSTVHDAAVFAVTELTTNVVRHAAPQSPFFELLLTVTDSHVEVGVRDSHPGLVEHPEPGAVGGLAVVADLAHHLGGALAIRPDPGGGRTVCVLLPLAPPLGHRRH
ncbi:ATP-binding protein [Streptomyces kaniharaensis]|uniref:ATP-binding protein n=1 Tax=Streptomyces kaniharaensis TaxID=212423 RepID=UPI0012954DCA|nr:ATP-binding protein [Streptomyces kaniharaensis]